MKKLIITDDIKKLFGNYKVLSALKAATIQRFTRVKPTSLASYVLNAAKLDIRIFNPVVIQEMSISGGYHGNTLDRERMRSRNFKCTESSKELYKELIDNDDTTVLWWTYSNINKTGNTGGKIMAHLMSVVSK